MWYYYIAILLLLHTCVGYRQITTASTSETLFQEDTLLDTQDGSFYVELQFHTKPVNGIRDVDHDQNQRFAIKLCGLDPHQSLAFPPVPITFDAIQNANRPLTGIRASCSSRALLVDSRSLFQFDEVVVGDWRYSGCELNTAGNWSFFRDTISTTDRTTAIFNSPFTSVCQMGLSWASFTFDEDLDRALGTPVADAAKRVYNGMANPPVDYTYQVDNAAGDCQLLCGSYSETTGCTKKCHTDPAVCDAQFAHSCTCDETALESEPGYCGFEFLATAQDWLEECGPFTQSAFRICSSQGTKTFPTNLFFEFRFN